jgi:hypothetical protein
MPNIEDIGTSLEPRGRVRSWPLMVLDPLLSALVRELPGDGDVGLALVFRRQTFDIAKTD